MARARNIKPGFFQNEDLLDLPFEDRLLFAGLWTLADREGRLEYRPKKIKIQIFPADNVDVHQSLTRLAEKRLVLIYAVDNTQYISIPSFLKHQNPHVKEAPSSIPPPPEHSASTVQAPDEHRTSPAESLLPITESLLPITPPLPPPVKTCVQTETQKPIAKRFKPPDISEVIAYCRERDNHVDPQLWYDHYAANGWKVGRNGMKDWKAAVRTWEKQQRGNGSNETHQRIQPETRNERFWRELNELHAKRN